MRRRQICDTNSLIYLAKCGLLELWADHASLCITADVLEECVENLRIHSKDAGLIRDLVANGKIELVQHRSPLVTHEGHRRGEGEKSILRFYEEKRNCELLTDDGEVVKICRQKKIPFMSSPMVSVELFNRNALSLGEGFGVIKILGEIGFFSKDVLDLARKALVHSQRIQSVLFDMDGVLIDSMKVHDKAWRQALSEQGVDITQEEIYKREGEKGTRTARDLLQKKGMDPTLRDIDGLIQRKRQILSAYSKIDLFAKAEECIEFFYQKDYRLGLVTGSYHQEVQSLMPKKMFDRFHAIIAADHVEEGKPHPEPYQKAMSQLLVHPSTTLVIENAPYGIASAKSAGAACIALTTSLDESHLKEADWILSGLEELMAVFA